MVQTTLRQTSGSPSLPRPSKRPLAPSVDRPLAGHLTGYPRPRPSKKKNVFTPRCAATTPKILDDAHHAHAITAPLLITCRGFRAATFSIPDLSAQTRARLRAWPKASGSQGARAAIACSVCRRKVSSVGMLNLILTLQLFTTRYSRFSFSAVFHALYRPIEILPSLGLQNP